MMPFLPRKKSYLAILVALSLSACSAIQPRPLEEKDLLE